MPILLAFAYLGIRQINWYPPDMEEVYSMYNAGWLVGRPFSPLEILESLYNRSPNHTPGYFLLLSAWGRFTSYNIATGRVLSILFGLLSLAIAYRLTRKIISPAAGFFAIVLIVSNTFYNFYVVQVRMYTVLFFVAGLLLYLYLHIVDCGRKTEKIAYILLGSAVFLLLNLHAYSLLFLVVLAVYHLLFVTRDQSWKSIIVTAAIATALCVPWFLVILTAGVGQSAMQWTTKHAGAWDNIVRWLVVITNGQPILLAIPIGGLVLASRKGIFQPKPLFLLVIVHILLLGILADSTPFVFPSRGRYQLPSWHFFVMTVSAGMYCLYLYRRWLCLLVLLWPIAGTNLQSSVEWKLYLGDRWITYRFPPWQVIAPLAGHTEPRPELIGYQISRYHLEWPSHVNFSQREHYFDPLGVNIDFALDPHQLKLMAQNSAIHTPRIWTLYQRSDSIQSQIEEVKSAMHSLDYELCDAFEVGTSTTILDYSWNVLECGEIEPGIKSESELVAYEFYAAKVDDESSTLFFADAWSPRDDLTGDDFMFSYQLISSDWNNVAQLDVPLVHEGAPRRFSIDVSDVPSGDYRLMVILYDRHTGERVQWQDNESYVPEMLALSEIVIPES